MSNCPNCGNKLKTRKQGSGIAYYCENCDYNIATSNVDPIFEDQIKYSITLLSGNKNDLKTIKLISSVANKNFIESKQIIKKAPIVIFEGEAIEIIEQRAKLDNNNVLYEISPVFPF